MPGGPTYGAVGDWSTARSDQPYNESTERRSQLSSPNITGILGGILPVVRTQRIRYALRMLIATASNSDRYRLFVRNAAGEFLDQDGAVIDPPDFFQPVDVQNRGCCARGETPNDPRRHANLLRHVRRAYPVTVPARQTHASPTLPRRRGNPTDR